MTRQSEIDATGSNSIAGWASPDFGYPTSLDGETATPAASLSIRPPWSPRDLIRRFETEAGLAEGVLLSPCRRRAEVDWPDICSPVDGRKAVMAYLHLDRRYSLPRIGRLFNRHHTTVLHAVRTARPDLLERVRRLAEG